MLPYEDNRVRVTPSRDNPFGYINASHISVSRRQSVVTVLILCQTVMAVYREEFASG